MRVLIVEDEPTLGQQLKSTLEGIGYAVDLSTDGEDGHFMGSTESYDAIILDPPKFGRGTKNETWRFEEDLPGLLDGVAELLVEDPLFVVLTAYAVRLSHIALAQALGDRLEPFGGRIEMGEMALPEEKTGRMLPTSICARWRAD